MNRVLAYAIPVIICFAVGFVASAMQSGALVDWYPYLNKSPLNPPDSVFPFAWSFLYLCMGLSIGRIIELNRSDRNFFLSLFTIQLFFNFMWSIVFFTMRSPVLGLVTILMLEFLIIYYAIKAYGADYKLSALLFVPYILWVAFATYLNYYIVMYN